MTRQSHIEAVAKKLQESNYPDILWKDASDHMKERCKSDATAAISALEKLGAYVGEGWEAVPSEPTEKMLSEARKLEWWPDYENGRMEPPILRQLYSGMLAAKPKPQGKE